MDHGLLQRVLRAQSANTTLSGRDLRAAAGGLLSLELGSDAVLWPVDAAGERIIGAASVLDPHLALAHDRTCSEMQAVRCVLVSGYIAGPVGLADAARTVSALGAPQVIAAVLGGWNDAIEGIDAVHAICGDHAHAA